MNMRDIEKAIREAEAAGDLPSIPEQQEPVDTPPDGESADSVDEPAVDQESLESLSVSFDQPSFGMDEKNGDDIADLLRELIEVCKRGFGY